MYCKNFSELSKHDAAIAGGKGASLGEMTNAGIPVPPGFVVLADAFEKFLSETNLNVEIDTILHTVKTDEMRSVEHASERIQKLILEAKMPEDIGEEIIADFEILDAEYVAVRSSATAEDSDSAAWAGQLDSFLNTTEESLLRNVQKCWASLFTPRAIFYRFEQGLHNSKISVAVVVQNMVESEVSGIAFSVHPVTEDRNQLIIEAGFGLGEAIVSGQITPDSYVVEKEPRRIIDVNVSEQERGIYRHQGPSLQGIPRTVLDDEQVNEWQSIPVEKRNQQKLSNEQILELSEIIIGIEKHYGFPCDIEWALYGRVLYITQSRPITTLEKNVVSLGSPVSQIFHKEFTRDNNIVLQEIWDAGYEYDFDDVRNPFSPTQINYVNDGVVEIWENVEALRWFGDRLQQKFRNDPTFFGREMERYLAIANQVGEYSMCKRLNDIQELRRFLDLIRVGTRGFLIFYYAGKDARTPKKVRERAIEIRDLDHFYDDADRLVKSTIEYLYPHAKGLTISILQSELEQPPIRSVLQKRFISSVVINGEPIHITNFSDFWEHHSEYDFEVDKIPSNMNELRGEVAYGGCMQGKVRILKRKNQIRSFLKNEVLVANMTTPDFVPAMKKASAVVTDEGGITCHAAIVARELKKPCIIGTKIATQVLHDGDLVEVDADNGVVRILERKRLI
jgi:phosphohistidine swiveling domain-containing protein